MVDNIIPGYSTPQQAKLRIAAQTWRLDWAVGSTVPRLAQNRRYTAFFLIGVTVDIENPLYKFTMPHNEPMGRHGILGEENAPVRVTLLLEIVSLLT